jgi:hypothetical protein
MEVEINLHLLVTQNLELNDTSALILVAWLVPRYFPYLVMPDLHGFSATNAKHLSARV